MKEFISDSKLECLCICLTTTLRELQFVFVYCFLSPQTNTKYIYLFRLSHCLRWITAPINLIYCIILLLRFNVIFRCFPSRTVVFQDSRTEFRTEPSDFCRNRSEPSGIEKSIPHTPTIAMSSAVRRKSGAAAAVPSERLAFDRRKMCRNLDDDKNCH